MFNRIMQFQETLHSLIFVPKLLKIAVDNGLCTGIGLTDLSKAFGSISHDLLIDKLHVVFLLIHLTPQIM